MSPTTAAKPRRTPRHPRQPHPLPITALPEFLVRVRADVVPALTMMFSRAGSPARLTVPGVVNLIFVNHHADAEHIMVKHQDIYVKGREYDVPALGLRNGLVTSTGEQWARDRKLLNPMFARRHLEPFTETMASCVAKMLHEWDEAEDGAEVEVNREMQKVSLDMAARTMFGARLTEEEVELTGELVNEVLRDILLVGNSPLTWMFQALPGLDLARVGRLHWRGRRIAGRLKQADELIERQIDARRSDPQAPQADLLALLLNAHNEDTDHRLTRQEVIEQCGTFLGAGHETTGTGTTWFWHLMSENPGARARMVAEVDEVLGGRPPTFEDIDKLVWTRACFSEAMRIHPPVYMSMRSVTQDDVMNGYIMDKGSIVIILTHLIHRDPDVWPDPERFDPERFMPGADKDRPRMAYLPFGGGRRICIGSQFAMMEATIIAAMTSQRFTLDAFPGWKVREEGTTTLRPKGGLPMVLRRRTDAPALAEVTR